MNDIKFIFSPLEEIFLSAGCCCTVIIPEGYAHGTKLTVVIDPPEN